MISALTLCYVIKSKNARSVLFGFSSYIKEPIAGFLVT